MSLLSFLKKKTGITPEKRKTETKLGMSSIVPDLVNKFQMIC
jgi:hypothetical protein